MTRGMRKAERLIELERLLTQSQAGLTITDLAGRMGVDRTTIWRDLNELGTSGVPILELEDNRYTIDRVHYLSNVRLNATESLMLYLAARRLSRHTRFARPAVTSALEKLSVALRQPMTERIQAAAARIMGEQPPPDLEKEKAIETVVRGWMEGLRVKIWYRKLRADQTRVYVVSPYLVEPSIWGDGAYLIGYSDHHDGLGTFKIERIQRAALINETFEMPADLNEDELLRHAWGIWYGEEEPTTVRLRFSSWVADRVRESVWHPTQRITALPDGGCEWAAEVDATIEMVPWIRGWGPDCEVLEPDDLRARIAEDMRRAAAQYTTEEVANAS